MVSVAQSVELRIVIPAVVGSSPIAHPSLPTLRMGRRLGWTANSSFGGPLAQLVEQLTLNQ